MAIYRKKIIKFIIISELNYSYSPINTRIEIWQLKANDKQWNMFWWFLKFIWYMIEFLTMPTHLPRKMCADNGIRVFHFKCVQIELNLINTSVALLNLSTGEKLLEKIDVARTIPCPKCGVTRPLFTQAANIQNIHWASKRIETTTLNNNIMDKKWAPATHLAPSEERQKMKRNRNWMEHIYALVIKSPPLMSLSIVLFSSSFLSFLFLLIFVVWRSCCRHNDGLPTFTSQRPTTNERTTAR